jgi:hypothetical protein
MAKKSRSGSANNPRPNPDAKRSPDPASTPTQEQATRRRERRASSMQGRKEERLKRQQQQKRQWLYTRIGIGVVLVALIGWFGWIGWQTYQGYSVRGDTTEYFGKDDFSAAHYDTGEVLYEQVPPTGGWHNTVWQNCGYYDTYVENIHAVHSLEHGAVWITYDPGISEADKEKLKDISDQSYVLVSPYPGMDHPITLSIWGHQLGLDELDEGKIEAFIREFKVKQEYTPEFGAICYGGTSGTTDQEPQQQPYIQADPEADPIGGIRDIDATATAEALNPSAAASPESTPVPGAATPAATPEASPAASPVAIKSND